MAARKLLVLFALIAVSTANVASADSGTTPHPCAGCHGVDGLAAKAGIPHLNGQILDYLEHAMAQFQYGHRPGRGSGHESGDIDKAQMADVLKSYSTAKAVRPRQEKVDTKLAALGETIYRDRCADCHPDNGRESDNDAPLMAAQDLDYLIKQTHSFVDGKRKFASMMGKAFKDIADTDLEAVAHFFASQDQMAPAKPKKRRR